ncbi:MAG: DUF5666 domain-containing protein [Candidatus Sulfotelmatobacter sp.]
MSPSTQRPRRYLAYPYLALSAVSLAILIVIVATSCSSGSKMSETQPPQFSGNTSVMVLLSSAANAQITDLQIGLQSLKLTSQSGGSVTLLSSPQNAEYIHVNGTLDVLGTTSVPQGIYTSASAVMSGAQFTCVTFTPASSQGSPSLDTSEFSSGSVNSPVSVNLSSPLTITGKSMGLVLALQVSQSASYSNCYPEGISTITPSFNLAPMRIASQPTNSGDGKVLGVQGTVASTNPGSSGFTLSISDGPFSTRTVSVTSSGTTVFQGIAAVSALSTGMFVNLDGALQDDGSLLATRLAVEDTGAQNLLGGPVLEVASDVSDLTVYGRLAQGSEANYIYGTPIYNFGSAVFQVSGELGNLQNLPFTPAFNGANIVPGQNVDITSGALVFTGGVYTPATTITLIPQTINGDVISSSESGNFTVYGVALAPYDLFPTLAAQPGQNVVLNSADQVEVYVDNSTQLINSPALVAGSTLRFYGLVFNDNGTLRMDCAQVTDGVAFQPQPSTSEPAPMKQEVIRQTRTPGGVRQIVTTSRPQL